MTPGSWGPFIFFLIILVVAAVVLKRIVERPCPSCRQLISRRATKCQHCGSAVP